MKPDPDMNAARSGHGRAHEGPARHPIPLALRMRAASSFRNGHNATAPETLGRLGNLEVRLAVSNRDLRKAQKLRYRVFYKELSARADTMTRLKRRDADAYDALCDHLLVLDHNPAGRRKPKIVGTYRLLRQEVADRHGGFYTQGEFDIEALIAARPADDRFLELGRSCVLKPYRNRRTLELLWQGIWAYARRHRIDAMFGCASFPGINPHDHRLGLSFLHHHARAVGDWQVRAHPRLRQEMDLLPRDAIDPKAALRSLPALIKGYLRVGAKVGDGAVIDHQFGTIDVAVVMPVTEIDGRYLAHFSKKKQPGPASHPMETGRIN